MDPKALEQFMQFQQFLAMQQAASEASPATNPAPAPAPVVKPEDKVAAHLRAKQAQDQDGETVGAAAAAVAAKQKLSGPTLTITPKAHVPEGMIYGVGADKAAGGPPVPLSDFPSHATLHYPDGSTAMVPFGSPKARTGGEKSSGKPGADARGQVARGLLKFQVGINYTRIHKGD